MPLYFAGDYLFCSDDYLCLPLCAQHAHGISGCCTCLLTAEMGPYGSVLVPELNSKVVIDISVLRIDANLSPTGAHSRDGHDIAHGPGHHIQAMDSLFDDEIA